MGEFKVERGVLVEYKGKDEIIEIPEGVEETRDLLCYGLKKAKRIIFPKSIKRIGKYSFSSCHHLESVQMPDNVIIGKGAFYDCSRLKSISDRGEIVLRKVEEGAFQFCSKLETKIVIGFNENVVGKFAFQYCDCLKNIVLPEYIIVEEEAFANCERLETISDSNRIVLAGCGENAFNESDKLKTEIIIDETKKRQKLENKKNTFVVEKDSKSLSKRERKQERKAKRREVENKEMTENDLPFVIEENVLKNYLGDQKEVHIPEKVTEIGDGAFRWDDNVTEIYFEGKITQIGEEAFMGCEKLKRVNLPHKIVIGKEAFQDCTALETITDDLIYTLGETGEDAFCGCENLHNDIEIAEGTIELKDGVFDLCEKIKKIYIPDSLRTIGNDSFYEVGTFICKRNVGIYLELQDMGFQCVMKEREGRKILKNIEQMEAMQAEDDDSRPQWESFFPESIFTVEEQWLYGIHPDDEMYKKLLELEVIRKFSGRWKL